MTTQIKTKKFNFLTVPRNVNLKQFKTDKKSRKKISFKTIPQNGPYIIDLKCLDKIKK